MANYQTGIAAEFYVLSLLYRLGLDANLTLGNRKAIDIMALNDHEVPITIDVKGLAGKTGWPVDNVKLVRKNHVLVFLSFMDKITDLTTVPNIYVVPSVEVEDLIYTAVPSGRRLVQFKTLRNAADRYANAWHFITDIGSNETTDIIG